MVGARGDRDETDLTDRTSRSVGGFCFSERSAALYYLFPTEPGEDEERLRVWFQDPVFRFRFKISKTPGDAGEPDTRERHTITNHTNRTT